MKLKISLAILFFLAMIFNAAAAPYEYGVDPNELEMLDDIRKLYAYESFAGNHHDFRKIIDLIGNFVQDVAPLLVAFL
jgi:hypothetical protein